MALKLPDAEVKPQPVRPPVRAAEPSSGPREIRSFPVLEFRVETAGDGKKYFTGCAAPFNSRSEILADKHGKFVEIIRPGAFRRAIAERQDVRHLINHNPSLLLGRTVAGTTELTEMENGLTFRTLMGGRSYERDLEESVARGDISGCSFAFTVHGKDGQRWGPDAQNKSMEIRELLDLDIGDVSIVTYPAYGQTSAAVSLRAMFPDGVPPEVLAHAHVLGEEKRDALCECTCESCVAGNCDNCTNTECDDENCDANWDDKAHNVARRDRAIAVVRGITEHGAAYLEAIRSNQSPYAALEFRANPVNEGTCELLLYGDIGESWYSDGITAKWIKAKLDEADAFSKIRLRIHSFGGDAFEGLCIGNYVKSLGKPVAICIDGLAASAASVVAMCGDTITMAPNAMMMIHNASSMGYGYASDFRKLANVLEKISASLGQTYVARTGNSAKKVQDLMDAETWMSAKDCLDNGFATEIATPGEEDAKRTAAMLDMARRSKVIQLYRNVPESLRTPSESEIFNVAQIDIERERIQLRARAAAASL